MTNVFKPGKKFASQPSRWLIWAATLISLGLLASYIILFPPSKTIDIVIGNGLFFLFGLFLARLLLGNWRGALFVATILTIALVFQIFLTLTLDIIFNSVILLILVFVYFLL